MKIYLVGGAVRDKLLGFPDEEIKEKDWVVVGATVEGMLKLKYRQVGKDFPVFLHPETNEEYALARKERKVGLGYTGFTFDTSSQVTLEEDLLRRDLTINAIAKSSDGDLVDPYHGQNDLNQKILRHVSNAFVEDPVRILRVARFAARFSELGFTVAPETMELMRSMVKSGEVDALVAERVWKELERALAEDHPEKFFEVLKDCDALSVLFPTLTKRSMDALIQAVAISPEPIIRFASLLHDQSLEQIKEIGDRYRVPSEYRELAQLVAKNFLIYQNAQNLSAEKIVELLQSTDAFRREERFEKFLMACEAIDEAQKKLIISNKIVNQVHETELNARLLMKENDLKESDWLRECFKSVNNIDVKAITDAGYIGKEIAAKLIEKRIKIIQDILNKK